MHDPEISRLRWIEHQARALVFNLREDAKEARAGLGVAPASPEFADGVEEAAKNLEDILAAGSPAEPPLTRAEVTELRENLRRTLAMLDVMADRPPAETKKN